MKIKIVLTGAVIIIAALAILSGAIALPILIRPFYYAHIKPLGLEDISGLEFNDICDAYNHVMDYCTGLSQEFSAGVFEFSDSGASHFADVRNLFILDIAVFLITSVILIASFIVLRKTKHSLCLFCNRSAGFWAAVSLISVFALIAVLVSIDFSAAFTVFHKLFFPGKTNWTFSIYDDPVILILPEVFFRNCAIFIFANLVITCTAIIITDLVKHKKHRLN